MVDFNKPIEYWYCRNEWKAAKLLDKDYNGAILIKYKVSSDNWTTKVLYGTEKLRNVPEKKTYRVVVTKNVNTGNCFASTVDREYIVGETYPHQNNKVIAYFEGEYE